MGLLLSLWLSHEISRSSHIPFRGAQAIFSSRWFTTRALDILPSRWETINKTSVDGQTCFVDGLNKSFWQNHFSHLQANLIEGWGLRDNQIDTSILKISTCAEWDTAQAIGVGRGWNVSPSQPRDTWRSRRMEGDREMQNRSLLDCIVLIQLL